MKLLVLCVDRDNDIGEAINVETPIMGKDKVMEAAAKFALACPEDSDVNAIFAALQLYEDLRREGSNCEIAIVTGLREGGVKADTKILSELDAVLEKYPADAAIFVSDGAADEQVIPVVQTKIPIYSIKRVFVQQSKSVEETYVVFVRYLKKLVKEPQYSRIFLGVPGLLTVVFASLYLAGLFQYAGAVFAIIVGGMMFTKGFNLDEYAIALWHSSPIRFLTAVIAIIVCTVAIYRGAATALLYLSAGESLGYVTGIFLQNAVDLFILGLGIFIGGRLFIKYVEESPELWHDIVFLVALIFLRQILMEAVPIIQNPLADFTTLLITVGLAVLTCSLLVAFFTLVGKIALKREGGSAKPA